MKVVILAGGAGTRLAEETGSKPKPMVEVGGSPILWHIMSIYMAYGHSEFVIALGHKGDVIKDYFLKHYHFQNSLSINLGNGHVQVHDGARRNCIVRLIDTGLETQTGGRVKRLTPWIGGKTFMMTYGDGVAKIDLDALVAFHLRHGKLATVTAVRPPARFGGIALDGDAVK